MAQANLLDMVQSKGNFKIEGVLSGMTSANTFKINDAGTWKTVNLMVRVSDGEVIFVKVQGGKKESVYLSKSVKKDGKFMKPETKKVDWADRAKESRGGWTPMGVSLALTRDEDGKPEFTSKVEWDAFDYIKENAVDDMPVVIVGDIEFSTYEKDGETKHARNLIAKKIYLRSNPAPIDFSSPTFKKVADFHQNVVFMGATKSDGETPAMLECGIVGWHSFQHASFETTDKFVSDIKGHVKMFNSLTLSGNIINSQRVETVTAKVWGEDTTTAKATNFGRTVLLVTGADQASLSTDTYSKKMIEEYIDAVASEKKAKEEKATAFESQSPSGKFGDDTTTTSAVSGWDDEG